MHTIVDVQGVSINDTRLGAANYADVILGSPIVGLMTGIVEVFVVQYDRWLPVCSTTWDNSAESKVLCQQLGFNETRTPGIFELCSYILTDLTMHFTHSGSLKFASLTDYVQMYTTVKLLYKLSCMPL